MIRHRLIRASTRVLARSAIAVVARLHLDVTVDVPRSAIFVAPHRGAFDVPLGITTFRALRRDPLLVVSQRQLDHLHVPAMNWAAINLLPITADADGRDLLLTKGAAALRDGGSVAIMPEGRILRDERRQLDDAKPGAALLATATSKPVVVMGTAGVSHLWVPGRAGTFVHVPRFHVVASVSEILADHGDVADTHARIIDALQRAELRAHEVLADVRRRTR